MGDIPPYLFSICLFPARDSQPICRDEDVMDVVVGSRRVYKLDPGALQEHKRNELETKMILLRSLLLVLVK